MTAVDETAGAATAGSARRQAQGGPAAHHRARHYVDNMQLPGMLWMAVVRSPVAHARSPRSTPPRPSSAPAWSRSSPPTTWRDDIAEAASRCSGPRPASRSRRPCTGRSRAARSSTSARRSRSSIGEDRYSVVDAAEDVLRRVRRAPGRGRPRGGARGRRAARPRGLRHQQDARLVDQRRRRRRGARRGRGRRRAADRQPPHLGRADRAALHDRRPARRRADALLDDADPAHRALRAVGDPRHAPRTSCAWSRPTSAAASGRSSRSTARRSWSPRSPASSVARSSGPSRARSTWRRRTTAATRSTT